MNNWHDFLSLRIEGLETDTPKFLEDKVVLYDFCLDKLIPTPKIYHIFESPEKIDLKKVIPNDFVIKPSFDSSSRGVMVLSREDDRFFNSLSGNYLKTKDIINYQKKYFFENRNKGNKIIIQEKVYDFESNYKVPRDFKFYAFNGEIALILVIDRNYKPAISLWYDENFQPITDDRVKCISPYARTLTYYTPPTEFKVLKDFAIKISKLIRSPFASIDIYHSTYGPMLGEVTLTPGGIYYGQHYILSDKQEFIMGKMWLKAKEELDSL